MHMSDRLILSALSLAVMLATAVLACFFVSGWRFAVSIASMVLSGYALVHFAVGPRCKL